MKYIQIKNNNEIEKLSEQQIYEQYPDTIDYRKSPFPRKNLLKKYGIYPLISEELPEADVVTEGTPIFKNGEFHETYKIRSFTKKEKAEKAKAKRKIQKKTHAKFSERKQRLEICSKCEFYRPLAGLCTKCGCVMPVKAVFKNTSCPISKW